MLSFKATSLLREVLLKSRVDLNLLFVVSVNEQLFRETPHRAEEIGHKQAGNKFQRDAVNDPTVRTEEMFCWCPSFWTEHWLLEMGLFICFCFFLSLFPRGVKMGRCTLNPGLNGTSPTSKLDLVPSDLIWSSQV